MKTSQLKTQNDTRNVTNNDVDVPYDINNGVTDDATKTTNVTKETVKCDKRHNWSVRRRLKGRRHKIHLH